jgi:hypothetical protein
MAVQQTESYRNCITVCNALMQRIINPDTNDKDCSLLARVWVEVEVFRREMRGIPRLSTHSVEDLAKARSSLAKRLSHSNPPETPYTELDASNEQPAAPETPPASTEP